MPEGAELLDDPVLRRRLGATQTLCLGFILGLAGIALGISLVVGYALEWQPLAGNAVLVSGISITTVIALVVTLLSPLLAMQLGQRRTEAEVRAIASAHPETIGTSEEADRYFTGFAGATFVEYAVAIVVGLALSILFHINSDPRMLGLVGCLLLFMIVRYPYTSRARRWLDEVSRRVAVLRENRLV